MADTGSRRAFLVVMAVLATVAGLYVLSFTDLEWRGLLGWGLQLLGLVLLIVGAGLGRTTARIGRR
ncbi:hypothetical protein [Micrococcus sp.]|uniref:hypothetical protein n=1 Tax=Micrococcus sp. TaxID=1271 RepID=UPI0026DA70D8|nr:hypothetical protein [Micrococcus sp.]MDO4239036.1 hypothetical protein [Micrococcus sp.]